MNKINVIIKDLIPGYGLGTGTLYGTGIFSITGYGCGTGILTGTFTGTGVGIGVGTGTG